MGKIQLGTWHEVPMTSISSLVASEKYLRVYLLLNVRFYLIFLLRVIFYPDLFLILILLFLLFSFYFIFSFLQSAWLSRDVSYLLGGESSPLQGRKRQINSIIINRKLWRAM